MENIERATGVTLFQPGETAIVRAGRNHIIKCRFGARHASLSYRRWTGSKYEDTEIHVDTRETHLYNDTGRDGNLTLMWKDPPDRGDVRVTKLSTLLGTSQFEEEEIMRSSDDYMFVEGIEERVALPDLGTQERGGGVIAVRVWLEVQGLGSFTDGQFFDTANGNTFVWVKPGHVFNLTAKPAPGWEFGYWLVNGNFAGAEPELTVGVATAYKIGAVFTQPLSLARESADGWWLEGPGKEDSSTVPAGCHEVKYSNHQKSQFSVQYLLNNSQLGWLSPGQTSDRVACVPGDKVRVKSGPDAEAGQVTTGNFTYYARPAE